MAISIPAHPHVGEFKPEAAPSHPLFSSYQTPMRLRRTLPHENGYRLSAIGYRLSAIFTLALLLVLAACATEPSQNPAQVLRGAGGNTPQDVTTSFFEDFNKALSDPNLADAAHQRDWA